MGTVVKALVHKRIMFWLWKVLFLSTWSTTGHAKYSSPMEVVIPLRVTDSMRHNSSPGWLSYSLYFGEERHTITMKPKKNLISRNFLLLTYSDQGDILSEQPFVQDDCYYHGYVDEDPESIVALTTCLGSFQGILEINGTVYEIMPKSSTSTFEHLAYKMGSEESESIPMRCGLSEEEIARQMSLREISDSTYFQSQYGDWWLHHKYLEYFVIIDHKRYVHRKGNTTKCLQDILQMVNGINGYYLQIDTEVVLTTLEVWNEKNHVDVERHISNVLGDFCGWKKRNIGNQIRHDIIHLFARQGYGMYLGLAFVGTVCTPDNCAVNSFLSDSMSHMASVIAHEMGHNLGMGHDDKDCTCGRKSCIMAAYLSGSDRFSNCSYNEMFTAIGRRSCLYNIPDLLVIAKNQTCGNNLVEEGEQCDCGTPESCQSDPCCSEDCIFKPGAQCAVGLCCKSCKFIPTGTVCRKEKNECDLPEWCNGTSAACPDDVYLEDGSPCRNGGYCYKAACHNRQVQCQKIFGKGARSADERCYMEMNKRGDRFGNCGNNSYTYIGCNSADVLCGRIQCENVTELPPRREHETMHWVHFNNSTCWSLDYHFGIRIADLGAVADGTACGKGRICIDRKCVNKSILLGNCSERLCNKKGVCNSKHHCHCDPRWKPPYCLRGGFGGSIDSGPPPGKHPNWVPFLLVFLFLFLIVIAVITFVLNKMR
ncbi:disintegrin and metalloproteinase domain-containing protein 26A-like [Meriones unguiculatus]|uniref:disintegrin and metalloproteinase domain-containing protein 26A-like n=1 Tax=Meriones unguiculatus TaxID=10047 RepID=UPI00293F0F6C|nr:disintegrin and metalloproteinase domain-containing protein 26A-like [Meriones unguiculatus]